MTHGDSRGVLGGGSAQTPRLKEAQAERCALLSPPRLGRAMSAIRPYDIGRSIHLVAGAETSSMPSPNPSTGIARNRAAEARRAQEALAAQEAQRTQQPQAQAAAAVAAPVPQEDWTRRLADPAQMAAARTRHQGQVQNPQAAAILRQNENAEMDAIGGKNQPGRLMSMGGNPRRGTTVTVHGINDNPASVLPLGEDAAKSGKAVSTFAWDDRSRRLGDSANDFATEIARTLRENPDAPLTINAYSMGGRVAAVGLGRLEEQGLLKGRKVELNLVATPLQGFGSANMAWMGAPFSSNLRSARDMGSRSGFQRELEAVRLPNVNVRVLGGGADETAVVDDKWREMARNLSGREPEIMAGATHESAVAAAADRLD